MRALILGLALLPVVAFADRAPNVVVIFADDLGYGDLSCYGQRRYQTPHLDRMAREGMRFTDFYSASPGCSPSRAALLTGCYPQRVSLPGVLGPESKIGLHPDETTIADMLKSKGYATGMVGKWHLGVTPPLMPLAQGFDAYFGLPYSNDMWPVTGKSWPPLFLMEGDKPVIEVGSMEEQGLLTRRYTERAVSFIHDNASRPFFLYVAHSMPHVPIMASPTFLGKSGAGLYADMMLELDWSVGEILDALRKLKLDKDTLVVFSSDNGPWIPFGDHSGVTGGLREGKGTTFEGGMRVPGLFWWPGKIPAGSVSSEVATTMDVLPTVARLASAPLPERDIDGHDIWPLLTGASAVSPTRAFFYYWPGELQAVRVGRWKLHVPHNHRHQEGTPGAGGKSAGEVTRRIELSLFDLKADPFELTDLSAEHPELVQKLLRLIEAQRRMFGDPVAKVEGVAVRPPGRVAG